MQNIIILDLETARSADDCRVCFSPTTAHSQVAGASGQRCPGSGAYGYAVTHYTPIGWDNKTVLGLSVGCYFDTIAGTIVWFDEKTLEATVRRFVQEEPLLVSFNGIRFDFPLMRGILRQEVEQIEKAEAVHNNGPSPMALERMALCDAFKALCATSYDILAEIWKLAPADKFSKGLHSLDALAQANGLGAKTGHGAQAPRDWAAGRWATVLNYCQQDVLLTKALFELVLAGQPIQRSDGTSVLLPRPQFTSPQEVPHVVV